MRIRSSSPAGSRRSSAPAPSMADTVASGPVPQLVAFGRELRARGLPVGTGRILTFVRGVAALGLVDRTSLYWAGRASLVARRDDLEAYDRAFDDWYRSLGVSGELAIELSLPSVGSDPTPDWEEEPDGLEAIAGSTAAEWHNLDPEEDDEELDGESSIRIVASGTEVLRTKSFGQLTEDERDRVWALVRALTISVPRERTRRTRPSAKG